MTIGRTRACIFVAGMLAVVLTAATAPAALTDAQKKCTYAIAKGSKGFVAGKLKLLQKCRNAHLKDGSCTAPGDAGAISKLETKLNDTIVKACSLAASQLAAMGFPGPCTDANPGDGFTTSDLVTCIKNSHATIIDQMIDLQYDPNVAGPTVILAAADLKCQKEIAKQGAGLTNCILKNVQKCRTDVLKGKKFVPPDLCATDDPKTSAAIQKCKDKLTAGITKQCTDPQIVALDVCTPDDLTTVAAAATCLRDHHEELVDGPEITVPPDFIDYEYAVRGGVCGDNVINNLNEECDGTSDASCPGQCGTAETPDGFFACLCKTKPRMVIIEHTGSDTDNGWLGLSVDGNVVEGGGYLVDLYDCDILGNCNAGPSCHLPPHQPCSVGASYVLPFPLLSTSGIDADSLCPGPGNFCRKERTATGPHCYQNPKIKCDEDKPNDPNCSAPGDYCVTTFHGAPVPAAAGGIAVCNVSTFSEDVVGTVNILTGTSSLKVRQRAVARNPYTQNKPCPVCGNYCAVSRERCNVDGDCVGGTGPCITAAICSDGTRKDKSCRRTPPFGGNVTFFGVTSVDCPPDLGEITKTNQGLDINANPRTTGTVSLLPTFPCTAAGFTGNTCLGGSSEGRPCTVASECPGGSCSPQCLCQGQKKPNGCDAACVGGPNDKAGCIEDADCTPGFCHPADCRLNQGACFGGPNADVPCTVDSECPSGTCGDYDSNQEGVCSAGPVAQFCSDTTYRTCNNDAACRPPTCPFCKPDATEICVTSKRQCFINSGIIRSGTPHVPPPNGDGESAAIYCVPSNGGAIDTSAGFAGPGALIQRESVIVVPSPFPLPTP